MTAVDYDTWKCTDTAAERADAHIVAAERRMELMDRDEIEQAIAELIQCDEEAALWAASVIAKHAPDTAFVRQARWNWADAEAEV